MVSAGNRYQWRPLVPFGTQPQGPLGDS